MMDGKVVKSFIYHNANEKNVARIDRIEPGRNGKKKEFLPFLASGSGFAQKPGLDGVTLPLYHLPDVLRVARGGGVVFFLEGEGKADALAHVLQKTHDVVVTTIAGGANAHLRAEHITALDGARKIIVAADSDAPGRNAAATRAQAIADAYPQMEVRTLDFFPDRDDGSDAAEWLEAHRPRELTALVAAAPLVKAHADSTKTTPPQWEDLAPWPTLQEAALYGIAGDVVHAIAPHTEADPAALLFTFLTAAGNMLGPGPYLRVGSVRHTPRLFSVIVGASAKARKGQSFADIMAVLDEVDATAVEATRVSGLASGEGLIGRLRDREDGSPIEKRALIHEAEFARVLAVSGREGATLSTILRDAWDSTTLRVTTRKDPLEAKNVFISFLAHITIEELNARLTSIEVANGFANRMLFVAAKRSRLLPHGGRVSPETLSELGTRIREALTHARKLGEIGRSPDFSKAWGTLYCTFAEEHGLLGSIIARAETQTLRLALTYALLDGARELRLEHLIAGYAAWRYAEDSARHIFGRKLGDDVQQRLLDELRAVYPEGFDRSAQHDLFGRHTSVARLKDARENLLTRKLAVEQDEPTAGRSRSVLYALPREKSEKSEISPLSDPLSSLLSLFSQVKNDTEIIG